MSNLTNDKLKYLCPDSWVARTYGEYLAACASDQADLLSALSDAISDDSVQNIIDKISDEYHQSYDYIQNSVQSYLIDNNIGDPYSIDWNDEIVQEAFITLYDDSTDATFRNKVLQMKTNFPNTITMDARHAYQVLSTMEDEWIRSRSDFDASVASIASNVVSTLRCPRDFQVCMNEGFVPIIDLLKNMITHSNLQLEVDQFSVPAFDGNGSALENIHYSVDSVIDELKSSFASTVAWSNGFLSLIEDKLSDALLTFDANMETMISDYKEKFATSVATVRSTIASARANVKSFISQASEMLGWNKVRDGLFTKVNDTDIASYTGASPMNGVNLHSAVDLASAIGRTTLAVGAGIWEGIKAIGSKLWAKAKPIVMALTNNPVDIAVEDQNDTSYTVSNFQYQTSTESTFYFENDVSDATISKFYNMLSTLQNNSLSINTYFGELCVTITSYHTSQDQDFDDRRGLVIGYDLIFKPKCLNYRALINYGVAYFENVATADQNVRFLDIDLSWDSYVSWINSGEIYADDDEDEAYKYMGFIAAVKIMHSLMKRTVQDIGNQFHSSYGMKFEYVRSRCGFLESGDDLVSIYLGNQSWDRFHLGAGRQVPSSVTNLDFVKASSGYISYTVKGVTYSDFNYVPGYYHGGNTRPLCINNVAEYFLILMLYQKYDRLQHPADFLYLPYSNSAYEFSSGRYRIKTDAENANVANILANALLIAAVVLVTILVCKSISKVIKKKKFMKITSQIGVMDNAMWNGKKLTGKQQRKYLRLSKKKEKLQSIVSGFSGSETNSGSAVKTIKSVLNTVATESNIDVGRSIVTGEIQKKNISLASSAANSSRQCFEATNDIAGDLSDIQDQISGVAHLIRG